MKCGLLPAGRLQRNRLEADPAVGTSAGMFLPIEQEATESTEEERSVLPLSTPLTDPLELLVPNNRLFFLILVHTLAQLELHCQIPLVNRLE